jgi:hypothetical protein
MEEKTFALPARPSLPDREALIGFLNAAQDVPVRIAAGALRRHDTLTYQILLAATRDRLPRGLATTVELPGKLAQELENLGFGSARLEWEIAA